MNKLLKLWIEFKIAYYKWALDNINNSMLSTQKQIDNSTGYMRNWACEDLLELAEDRISVKVKIKLLERKLNQR